jgi:hypothetical protein
VPLEGFGGYRDGELTKLTKPQGAAGHSTQFNGDEGSNTDQNKTTLEACK